MVFILSIVQVLLGLVLLSVMVLLVPIHFLDSCLLPIEKLGSHFS
jgi:hypothetical protein